MRQSSPPALPPGPGPVTDPDGSQDPEMEASPPGWAPPPPLPPGPRNPDQPQAPAAGEEDAGSGSARTPLLTPASFKKKSTAYAAIAEALLIAAGGLANKGAALGDDDETFIPDDDDRRDIPPPLGRLAARRIPLGDAEASLGDLADLGQLAVGLAAYLGKGLAGWLTSRAEKRRRARSGTVRAEGLQPAQQP